jgi:hypothetical protein
MTILYLDKTVSDQIRYNINPVTKCCIVFLVHRTILKDIHMWDSFQTFNGTIFLVSIVFMKFQKHCVTSL